MQEIIYTHNTAQALETLIADLAPNKLFVLTDEHTHELCKPRLDESPTLRSATSIVIGSSDANKTLESLAHVWQSLGDAGATRHSLLICLGGGMITDLGGFAEAVKVTHEEVTAAANAAQPRMTLLMRELVKRI